MERNCRHCLSVLSHAVLLTHACFAQIRERMAAMQEAMKKPEVQKQMAEMQAAMQNQALQERMAQLKAGPYV